MRVNERPRELQAVKEHFSEQTGASAKKQGDRAMLPRQVLYKFCNNMRGEPAMTRPECVKGQTAAYTASEGAPRGRP